MSAFLAAINWNQQPLDPATLEAANAVMRYRCPDGGWTWTCGSVGLAQVDLATLPEDVPGVPVVCGNLRIVASCRIDNRAELLRTLPPGLLTPTAPDAAFILAAYKVWGSACVDRLIGDFAFVIWDGNQQRIFAARDLSGARQLFYYREHQRLMLASERTQILQDPRVPFEIDEEQLIEFLTPTYHWTSGWDQGGFRNLFVLRPGWMLSAERGHVAVQRFWRPHGDATESGSATELTEQYRHILTMAVTDRLRSRHPQIGLELSGGLDSSAVACLAARQSHGSALLLHTFSCVFDQFPEIDERIRIQSVVEHYHLTAHQLIADRIYGPAYLNVDWKPHTICGPHDMAEVQVVHPFSMLVQQAGCRVILSGQMGDSLNDGSRRVYYSLLRRRRWREAVRWFAVDWAESRRTALGAWAYYGLLPFLPRPLLRLGRLALDARQDAYFDLPPYLAPTLRQRITELDRAIRRQRAGTLDARDPDRQLVLNELLSPMVPFTRPRPGPIELRHPYTDRRLIEFVLRLPVELKWDNTADEGRLHHRQALAGILPDCVRVANPGVDFTPVMRHNLAPVTRHAWLLDHPFVHLFERGYVEPESFLHALSDPNADHYYLGVLLSAEAWLRALEPGGMFHRLAGR